MPLKERLMPYNITYMWNQKVSHTCGNCKKNKKKKKRERETERERKEKKKSQFHRNRKYLCGCQGLK